jgi:hypothetical protein
MTVGELKELIANLPDNTSVIIPTYDHAYRSCNADVSTALFEDGEWCQDFGEEYTPDSEYGQRLQVVIMN